MLALLHPNVISLFLRHEHHCGDGDSNGEQYREASPKGIGGRRARPNQETVVYGLGVTTEIIASCICNIGSLIESANAAYWQTVKAGSEISLLRERDNGRVCDHFLLANYSAGEISLLSTGFHGIIYCVIKMVPQPSGCPRTVRQGTRMRLVKARS